MIDRAVSRMRLPREAAWIVGLFLAFRLMMLIALRPEHLTFFGDYPYYFELAKLSDRGLWPYLHYWMEYPPLFPFLSTIIYRLTVLGGYDAYVMALGAINVMFSGGNLILLMRLGAKLHGDTVASRLGWVQTVLFVPMLFAWWQFEALTAFCVLFALDRLIDRRDMASALATGAGVMVKLVPALLIPAVALTRPVRTSAKYVAVVVLVVAAILVPLLVAAPDTTRASLASPLAWSSWETVWALIDGNLRTGLLGGIDIHFDAGLATLPVGNPSRVPDGLKAIVFGAVYLALMFRVRSAPGDASFKTVGLLAITYVVFLLWSKGWSPQWQIILFPLVLLLMPDASGVGWVLIFGLVNLVEWPVLISRGLWTPVIATIVLRTLLLIVLLIELVRRTTHAND